MFLYILKRVLIFFPTLIAITLLTFAISVNSEGDPVEQMLNTTTGDGRIADKLASEETYNKMRHQLGLDLPVFYFSLSTYAQPDTLQLIAKPFHREMLGNMVAKYGNWPEIEAYYHKVRALDLATYATKKDSLNSEALIDVKAEVNELLIEYKPEKVDAAMSKLDELIVAANNLGHLSSLYTDAKSAYSTVKAEATTWKTYIPYLAWNGKNQYHRWVFGDGNWITGKGAVYTSGIIRGDFGVSYQDKRKVNTVLGERLWVTMRLSLISIVLTYLIAIPIGIFSAVNKGTTVDKISTGVLFALYSLPNFWIATLLITYLGGGDYLDWFPTYGLGKIPEGASFIEAFSISAYHHVLPVFCLTYGGFAFLSRQMRGGMLSVVGQDYIRTAYAKGLEKKTVIWKHAFRNSLLPIITLFANVFPLLIGGSVVIEVIFSIPGMGSWGYNAIIFKDYPVVFAVMLLAAVLTMIGYLVADILYAVVDPRISYSSKK